MSHLNFQIQILAFSIKFCPIKKLTCLVTQFNHKLFLPKWTIIGIFYDFGSTQNVNAACFEWDFFFDFQTPCPFDPKIVRVCRKKSTLKRHLGIYPYFHRASASWWRFQSVMIIKRDQDTFAWYTRYYKLWKDDKKMYLLLQNSKCCIGSAVFECLKLSSSLE